MVVCFEGMAGTNSPELFKQLSGTVSWSFDKSESRRLLLSKLPREEEDKCVEDDVMV
jgi:hypothetical protein